MTLTTDCGGPTDSNPVISLFTSVSPKFPPFVYFCHWSSLWWSLRPYNLSHPCSNRNLSFRSEFEGPAWADDMSEFHYFSFIWFLKVQRMTLWIQITDVKSRTSKNKQKHAFRGAWSISKSAKWWISTSSKHFIPQIWLPSYKVSSKLSYDTMKYF